MNNCPFCNSLETWTRSVDVTVNHMSIPSGKYRVVCKNCGGMGPASDNMDDASEKYNGSLLNEDMGGVSSPMSTSMNVPGMGSAVPPSPTTNFVGSGDSWGNSIGKSPYVQTGSIKRKKKKRKKVKESNVNPYDKIGTMMSKKMGVKLPFKKGKNGTVIQQKFESEQHKIKPLDQYES